MTHYISTTPWYLQLERPRFNSEYIDNWAIVALHYYALKNNAIYYRHYLFGTIKRSFQQISSDLHDAGARLIHVDFSDETVLLPSAYFTCDDTAVHIGNKSDGSDQSIEIVSINKPRFDFLKMYFKGIVSRRRKKGSIYILAQDENSLNLVSAGYSAAKYEPENYTQEVQEAYGHVVKDLRSSSPCGRFVLLEGPPGTGKTHLIRSFLTESENTMFVLIPPFMITQLVQPGLMPLLIKKSKGGPIVLLLEDADSCLVPRATDNIDSISALLNLSDGILGRLCDLRIIATTNAKRVDIDSALLRPGRLCRRIEVQKITGEHCNKVYARLTNNSIDKFNTKSVYTLAEVYQQAREDGWAPPKEELVKPKHEWDDDF